MALDKEALYEKYTKFVGDMFDYLDDKIESLDECEEKTILEDIRKEIWLILHNNGIDYYVAKPIDEDEDKK